MTIALQIGLVLTALIVIIGSVFIAFTVGKPREPFTPTSAAITLAINAAVVIVVILAALRLGALS